jgi:FkbM family methyltransferase
MSMETYTVDGHTFIPKLLKHNGWVIDAGCRGFNLSRELTVLGCNVYAIDMDYIFNREHILYFKAFREAALTHYTGEVDAYFFGNGTGNFIRPVNQEPGNTPDRPCEMRTVTAITLDDIYKEIGTDIDLLKMDIEGAEYEVMMKMEPIPKQITVEFHEHCHEDLHRKLIKPILERLSQWYHLHLFNVEPRYHYLDCLFIRKDIL